MLHVYDKFIGDLPQDREAFGKEPWHWQLGSIWVREITPVYMVQQLFSCRGYGVADEDKSLGSKQDQ